MRSLLLLLLLVAACGAAAEERYVDDQLVITLRSGQGSAYQILRTLRTGTRLELLDEEGEYAKVRTEDGIEGWVRRQYLSDRPVAQQRLAAAEERLATLQRRLSEKEKALTEARSAAESARETLQALQSEKREMAEELETLREVAAEPARLAEQNRKMRKEITRLEMETRLLQDENSGLRNRGQREWFIAGAGVLFGGILLGLLLPRLRRRSSGWGELK